MTRFANVRGAPKHILSPTESGSLGQGNDQFPTSKDQEVPGTGENDE